MRVCYGSRISNWYNNNRLDSCKNRTLLRKYNRFYMWWGINVDIFSLINNKHK